MTQYEVRATDNSITVRVEAENEQEAAEKVGLDDAYVYPAELPVGYVGSDPEE